MSEMREEFEKWAAGCTFYVDLSKGNHTVYTSSATHMMYCAWVCAWNTGRGKLLDAQGRGELS